jgi:hypothetical protein
MTGVLAAIALLHILLACAPRDCMAQMQDPPPASPPAAAGGETISISLSDRSPAQGDPVLVEVSAAPPTDNVGIVWGGKTFPMRDAGAGRFVAVIGVDLLEPPGAKPLSVLASGAGLAARLELEIDVREKAFPVQVLSLPKKMAEFDNATLERIRREAETLADRLSSVRAPDWDLPFLPPVEEYRPVGFGARRVINGEPRSPHAGVDLILPAGTPVRAIAPGIVAFCGDQFFGGRSVVLDHGGGLFSVYYHLRDSAVAEGHRVEKGDRIGEVGSSGRATGPHLHFGVRAAGGRIDPSLLFEPAFR